MKKTNIKKVKKEITIKNKGKLKKEKLKKY